MVRDDKGLGDGPEWRTGEEKDSPVGGAGALAPEKASSSIVGFRLPAGFAQSMMPSVGDALAKMLASSVRAQMRPMVPDLPAYARNILGPLNRELQDQLLSALPDYSALVKGILGPHVERLQSQMESMLAGIVTSTTPAMKDIGLGPATETILKQIAVQQSAIFEGLRTSLKPLFDPGLLRGFNRALLPMNLKANADEIEAHQVHEFLEQEGIPLYLVPRGRTALRLLRAPNRSARRQVLGDCCETIIDDCAAVLGRMDRAVVGDELVFALDGLGAMRAGHYRSAQAMFTVTLDTLIYRFYPDEAMRRLITNRKKGDDTPIAIEEMSVHEAMVWLPIWNAHEQFWKRKGDAVPRYYSRHASVHGVSTRQFNKRNCIQVLMLVTSLIGYADRLMSAVRIGA